MAVGKRGCGQSIHVHMDVDEKGSSIHAHMDVDEKSRAAHPLTEELGEAIDAAVRKRAQKE